MGTKKHTYTNNSSLALDAILGVIENESDLLDSYLNETNTERIRNTAIATLLFMLLNLTNPDCWATWFTLVGASILTLVSITYIIVYYRYRVSQKKEHKIKQSAFYFLLDSVFIMHVHLYDKGRHAVSTTDQLHNSLLYAYGLSDIQ